MNCIAFHPIAVTLLLLVDYARLQPDSSPVFIPLGSNPRPWLARYSRDSDDDGEEFSASRPHPARQGVREERWPPPVRSIPNDFASRKEANRNGFAEERVGDYEHATEGGIAAKGRVIQDRIGKRALGVFAHTRPFFKLSSNQANSELLNAFVRGNFGMSKLSFDRPRPLRWGKF